MAKFCFVIIVNILFAYLMIFSLNEYIKEVNQSKLEVKNELLTDVAVHAINSMTQIDLNGWLWAVYICSILFSGTILIMARVVINYTDWCMGNEFKKAHTLFK